MMACLGKTDAMGLKSNPEERESKVDHLEVPKEGSIVKPVDGQKKWYRSHNLTAGHCGQPEERIRGNCGSWKKLVAAGRKLTCRAGVAWRKRGMFRKDCPRSKVVQATQRVVLFRKILWMHHDGRRGAKDLGSKQLLYLRKRRATTINIRGCT
jgi:hypothetical protein